MWRDFSHSYWPSHLRGVQIMTKLVALFFPFFFLSSTILWKFLVVQGQCFLPWPSCSPHANWGRGDNPHGRLFSDPCALIITTNCRPTQQASLRSLLSALQSAVCKANSEICTFIYLFFSTNNIYYLYKNKKTLFRWHLSQNDTAYYIRIKWHLFQNDTAVAVQITPEK